MESTISLASRFAGMTLWEVSWKICHPAAITRWPDKTKPIDMILMETLFEQVNLRGVTLRWHHRHSTMSERPRYHHGIGRTWRYVRRSSFSESSVHNIWSLILRVIVENNSAAYSRELWWLLLSTSQGSDYLVCTLLRLHAKYAGLGAIAILLILWLLRRRFQQYRYGERVLKW